MFSRVLLFAFAFLIGLTGRTNGQDYCQTFLFGQQLTIDEGDSPRKIASGDFQTPFMKAGDKVAIDMLGSDGKSIFGRIEQTVKEV